MDAERIRKEIEVWFAIWGSGSQDYMLDFLRQHIFPSARRKDIVPVYTKVTRSKDFETGYFGARISNSKALKILASMDKEELARRLSLVPRDKQLSATGRLSLFLGKEVIGTLGDHLQPYAEEYALDLGEGCSEEPEVLLKISKEWWVPIGEQILWRTVVFGKPDIRSWCAFVSDYGDFCGDERIWEIFGQAAILTGREDWLNVSFAKLSSSWRRSFLRSLWNFFTGKSWREDFLDAQEAFKKEEKRRTFTPEGPLAFVTVYMLLSLNIPSYLDEARKLWNRIKRNVPEFGEDLEFIRELVKSRDRENVFVWHEMFSREKFSIGHVLCAWRFALDGLQLEDLFEPTERGTSYYRRMKEKFHRYATELKRHGCVLWASEIYGFLGDEREIQRIKISTGLVPTAVSGQSEDAWTAKLKGLEDIVRLKGAEGIGNRRVVWLVTPGKWGINIEPREQRLSANGVWKIGRKLSIQGIREGKYPFASHKDRLIASYAQEERYGFGRKYYRLKADAIEVLAGYPWVFDGETKEPVEVVRDTPKIVVEDTEQSLRVMLEPYVEDADTTVFIRKENGKFRFFVLDDLYRSLRQVIGKKGFEVPKEGEKQLKEVLEDLSSLIPVVGMEFDSVEEVKADATLYLVLKPLGEGLLLNVRIFPLGEKGPSFVPGKGQEIVVSLIEGKHFKARRDLSMEREIYSKVHERLWGVAGLEVRDEGSWYAPDLETSVRLLEAVEDLKDEKVKILWPEGKSLNIVFVDDDNLSVRVTKGIDWFEFDGSINISEEESLSISEVVREIADKKERFVQLTDGRIVALKDRLFKKLKDLAELSDIKKNKVLVPALRLLAMDSTVDAEEVVSFKERIDKAMNTNFLPPASMRDLLRPYQQEGFLWLRRLYEAGFGACLADDMGLGKTIQSLALLLSVAENGPSLVVAPASVVHVWEEEAGRFAPELDVINLGVVKDRKDVVDRATSYQVVVASYGLLQQRWVAELLQSREWNVVVLDEAQNIKNYRTLRAKAAYGLKARFRLATTGTPIENRLEELWSVFRFLNPGLLGSLDAFRKRFIVPIEREGDVDAKRKLKRLIKPFVLRRTKAQVLDELPPKTESTVYVELSPKEAAVYEELRREALEDLRANLPEKQLRFIILKHLTRLRLFCCSPKLLNMDLPESKLKTLVDLVEEIVLSGNRALVFSQFVKFMERIKAAFEERGIEYLYLDGSVPVSERNRRVKDFQRGKAPVFLISLRAGGTGLNLTAASYVVLADPWWNPMVEEQAADRVYRLGQKQPVTIYRLITKGTVEEKIRLLQAEKLNRIEEILEGTSTAHALSVDELMELLEAS